MRIGILTGGGDAPGLNAVIRAFVRRAVGGHGWEVVGVEDSFQGLLPERRTVRRLDLADVRGLVDRGGTVLGTTNRGDPFAFPSASGPVDRSGEIAEGARALGLDGLVVLGGDGTQALAARLSRAHGIPVIGVPKTIDNDLRATDQTFGFQSAVDVAVDAIDRLHTTAESHDRVMLLEVMGRDAGHIALHAAIAGGADAVLLPEIPWRPALVASAILARRAVGHTSTVIVVAEGALPVGLATDDVKLRRHRLREGGGAAALVAGALSQHLPSEIRAVVLGHLQRGGRPVAIDRLLATRFGVGAADLVAAGRWGEMVALREGRIVGVPLDEVVGGVRGVDPDGELVRVARAVGLSLGDLA
jgi:6-phosphofructokinase 1